MSILQVESSKLVLKLEEKLSLASYLSTVKVLCIELGTFGPKKSLEGI